MDLTKHGTGRRKNSFFSFPPEKTVLINLVYSVNLFIFAAGNGQTAQLDRDLKRFNTLVLWNLTTK